MAAIDPPRSFAIHGDEFLLNGKPVLLRSGELHYPRVPKEYWRDRMKKMRAAGLNALCTYVFWNLHEPEPGHFDFTGQLDLAAFVRTAQEEGLLVLLRPGPYICSEWDFGGLPAWLLKDPAMQVRTAYPPFLEAARRYLQAVGGQVKSLQTTRGGPIALVQVENEYGSYGKDTTYLEAIRKALVEAGFDVPFYTSDGAGESYLKAGTLPDVLPVVNFGQGPDPSSAFSTLDTFRRGIPRMCGEYWAGWFDHWGTPHSALDPKEAARGLGWMLDQGISFNIYMFHGGTNFGFMAGANWDKGRYCPDTTSYDYDAPLDEAGRPTAKFFAIRDEIRARLPKKETLPPLPQAIPTVGIPAFSFTACAPMEGLLGAPVLSERPKPTELLDQSHGFTLYRHPVKEPYHGVLEVKEVRDRALVLQGTKCLGTLDRRLKQSCLDVDLEAGRSLDLLVENMGRINYSTEMAGDRKGITQGVFTEQGELKGWQMHPLPLSDLSPLAFGPEKLSPPAFFKATFEIQNPGDTFLDTRGWGKGVLFINGHNLGRYWSKGPQRTLYCPGPWLRKGRNEVILLELEAAGTTMQGLPEPVFDPIQP